MMQILQKKRNYFYQIKQLILNMLENITQSFEVLCRVANDQQSLKPIENAIKCMDQYYDCIQFVKQDYIMKEIHFREQLQSRLIKHSSDINHISVYKDEVLSCGQEVYLFKQKQQYLITKSNLPIYSGIILSDGKVLLGGEEKVIHVYKQINNQYIETTQLRGFSRAISCIMKSQNEDYVGVSSLDGRITLYESESLNKMGAWMNVLGSLYSLSFSVDNNYLVAGSKKGIAIWEIKKTYNNNNPAELLQTLITKKKVRSVSFSRKQKLLAATHKKEILMYHYYKEDFKIYQKLLHHNEIVNCVSFGRDILVSGSDDATICLWSCSIKGFWICYQVVQMNCCINSIALNSKQTDIYFDCYDTVIHYYQI